jgi:ribosomal protein L7/L12
MKFLFKSDLNPEIQVECPDGFVPQFTKNELGNLVVSFVAMVATEAVALPEERRWGVRFSLSSALYNKIEMIKLVRGATSIDGQQRNATLGLGEAKALVEEAEKHNVTVVCASRAHAGNLVRDMCQCSGVSAQVISIGNYLPNESVRVYFYPWSTLTGAEERLCVSYMQDLAVDQGLNYATLLRETTPIDQRWVTCANVGKARQLINGLHSNNCYAGFSSP